MHRGVLIALTLLSSFWVAPAFAEAPAARTGLDWGVGARVGGYGFREVQGGELSWQDCRMNGTGVFATVDFTDYLFAELSADLYHATGAVVAAGMDRLSLHTLLAAGARFFPDSFVSPYVQVGAGPEFTRIDIGHTTDKRVLMAAFMGVGGELGIGRLGLGSNLRIFTMGLPAHHRQSAGGHRHDVHTPGLDVRHEVAGQLQFYARYQF